MPNKDAIGLQIIAGETIEAEVPRGIPIISSKSDVLTTSAGVEISLIKNLRFTTEEGNITTLEVEYPLAFKTPVELRKDYSLKSFKILRNSYAIKAKRVLRKEVTLIASKQIRKTIVLTANSIPVLRKEVLLQSTVDKSFRVSVSVLGNRVLRTSVSLIANNQKVIRKEVNLEARVERVIRKTWEVSARKVLRAQVALKSTNYRKLRKEYILKSRKQVYFRKDVYLRSYKVTASFRKEYPLLAFKEETPPPIFVNTKPSLFFGNSKLPRRNVKEFSIDSNDGDLFYQSKVDLIGVSYAEFVIGQRYQIDLEEPYHFIVTNKERRVNEEGEVIVSLVGVSPVKRLQIEDKKFPVIPYPINAKQLFQETLKPFAVEWHSIDFPVTLSAADSSKPVLDVLKNIAEAAGCFLESLPDGSLIVKPQFPFSVETLGPETKDKMQALSGDGIFSVTENDNDNKIFNRFTIGQSEGLLQDQLEFIQGGDPLEGEIQVFTAPKRDSVNLITTDRTAIIYKRRKQLVEKIENIKIENCQAEVNFPVAAIKSISITTPNLKMETFTDNILYFSGGLGWGLAEVTYLTEAIVYSVKADAPKDVLFLLEETEQ